MFSPWLAVYPALMAAFNAQRQAEEAAFNLCLHQERMRAYRRSDSIEVEARWVTDVPLLEALSC